MCIPSPIYLFTRQLCIPLPIYLLNNCVVYLYLPIYLTSVYTFNYLPTQQLCSIPKPIDSIPTFISFSSNASLFHSFNLYCLAPFYGQSGSGAHGKSLRLSSHSSKPNKSRLLSTTDMIKLKRQQPQHQQ